MEHLAPDYREFANNFSPSPVNVTVGDCHEVLAATGNFICVHENQGCFDDTKLDLSAAIARRTETAALGSDQVHNL